MLRHDKVMVQNRSGSTQRRGLDPLVRRSCLGCHGIAIRSRGSAGPAGGKPSDSTALKGRNDQAGYGHMSLKIYQVKLDTRFSTRQTDDLGQEEGIKKIESRKQIKCNYFGNYLTTLFYRILSALYQSNGFSVGPEASYNLSR